MKDEKTPKITLHQARTILEIGEKRRVLLVRLKAAILDGDSRAEHAIARELDNPYLDDFLRSFRERTGQKVLAKKGDFDKMQELLAHGGVLATLADQDAGARGQFVTFFNRPASTHKAVALMALEYNVPIVVIGTPKVGEPMRHAVLVEDVILPEEYDNNPEAKKRITQRFTAALERLSAAK